MERQHTVVVQAAMFRRWFAVCVVLSCCLWLRAEAPKEFAELRTKTAVYTDVRVISQNPSSITIRHSGGIAQIPFRDLSPELQQAFGYQPEEMEAFETQLRKQALVASALEARAAAKRAATAASHTEADKIDLIANSFATAPVLSGVDMRPKLRDLELYVKDQGRSPSCAVFAVVSALELQNYELMGQPEKLSEDYLVWATNQVTGARRRIVVDKDGAGEIDDAGYSLIDVFQALNRYGIPSDDEMKRFVSDRSQVRDMPKDLIASAQKRSGVIPYAVPGRDKAEMARNMVHVLNNGLPVITALRWPRQSATQGGLLSSQEPIPGYAHAVTVVGYSSETGKPEDLRFIFKNSWGPKWGATGYGFADMKYLAKNLIGAAFLELVPRRAEKAGGS